MPYHRALPAPPPSQTIEALADLIRGRRLVVLTGAGCSTESGIPDYRSPRDRPRSEPIRYLDFVRKPHIRQRYWARSMVGWPAVERAEPNAGHRALAELPVHGLITQNVDRLHHKAGSAALELHGALAEVRCLHCAAVSPRAELQDRLQSANPAWVERSGPANADGDAELSQDTSGFVVPECRACSGVLKPRVVFFGEVVAPSVVQAAYAMIERAEALLIAGSSLTVMSGLRFVRAAAEQGKPVGLVNLGPTRGDPLVDVRVEGLCGTVLPQLAKTMAGLPADPPNRSDLPRS